ncbi:hypothetical protein ATKI12_3391 [Kitasatospora sp. Ki12]
MSCSGLYALLGQLICRAATTILCIKQKPSAAVAGPAHRQMKAVDLKGS